MLSHFTNITSIEQRFRNRNRAYKTFTIVKVNTVREARQRGETSDARESLQILDSPNYTKKNYKRPSACECLDIYSATRK